VRIHFSIKINNLPHSIRSIRRKCCRDIKRGNGRDY
jgi:hypothetical protein